MTRGWFELGRYRGTPVRMHWTALVVPIVFCRFEIDVAYILGFATIVFVHELGHAFVARRRRLAVHEITIHGLGGHCRHDPGTELDGQVIAWGGVLAQAWLSVFVRGVLFSNHAWQLGLLAHPSLEAKLVELLSMNEQIALFNLIPWKRLDGARAWPLFRTILRGRTPPLGREIPPGISRAPSENGSTAANRVVADLVSNALSRASSEARENQD